MTAATGEQSASAAASRAGIRTLPSAKRSRSSAKAGAFGFGRARRATSRGLRSIKVCTIESEDYSYGGRAMLHGASCATVAPGYGSSVVSMRGIDIDGCLVVERGRLDFNEVNLASRSSGDAVRLNGGSFSATDSTIRARGTAHQRRARRHGVVVGRRVCERRQGRASRPVGRRRRQSSEHADQRRRRRRARGHAGPLSDGDEPRAGSARRASRDLSDRTGQAGCRGRRRRAGRRSAVVAQHAEHLVYDRRRGDRGLCATR